jgi:CRP-like cAMP-binding protein
VGASLGCLVRARGLELRPECARCTGQELSRHVMLPRHGILHTEGDGAETLYAVLQGFLRETRGTGDGRLQAVRLIFPGDLVGSEACVRGEYQGPDSGRSTPTASRNSSCRGCSPRSASAGSCCRARRGRRTPSPASTPALRSAAPGVPAAPPRVRLW